MLIKEMAKIELTGGNIENANDGDTKIKLSGGHIGIRLILKVAKIELTSSHIGIMLIKDITKKELTDGRIRIMLIIEMANIELI